MNEMTPIERIARAMAVARGMNPDAKSITAFDGAPRDCKVWETLVPSARAALLAIRDPTAEMVRAGLLKACLSLQYDGDSDDLKDELRDAFMAMIDKALAPE